MKPIKKPLILLILLLNIVFGIAAEVAPTSSRKISPIKVGDLLPDLVLTDTDHRPVRIQDYLADQPVILIYYRGGW